MLNHVTIELTGRCNLRCGHCYASGNGSDDLPPDTVKNIFEQLAELGASNIILSGGEPLMRKDIADIADIANGYGITPSISTNGTIYSSALKDCNIRDIQVSIDGLECAHDRLRGKSGAFKEAVENTNLFRQDGHAIIINSTIYRQNLDDVPELIELALGLDAKAYRGLLLMPVGRGRQLEPLTPNEADDFAKYMIQRKVELRGRLDIGMPQSYALLKGGRECCSAGTDTLCIKPNADITPCEFLRDAVIGNAGKDMIADALQEMRYDSCPALIIDGKNIYGGIE